MTKDRLVAARAARKRNTSLQGFSFAREFQKYGGRYALFDIRNTHNDTQRTGHTVEIAVLCHDIRKAGPQISVLITPVFGDGSIWVGSCRLRLIDTIPPEYLKPKTSMMYDLTGCAPTSLEERSL